MRLYLMLRTSMSESLIENGILDAVTKWLEPLNDKSLPSLVIQRSLFNILLNVSSLLRLPSLGRLGRYIIGKGYLTLVEPFFL